MLLTVYTLVALVSTALATPTPSYDFKQVSRAEVVRRIKRGVRPRAPVPSGAGGAPDTVFPTADNNFNFDKVYTGSGSILAADPFGVESTTPSMYATYPNTVSTASAAQQCVDLAFGPGYFGAVLWFDESDNLWHCRATLNQNSETEFTVTDANARPVYAYNFDFN